MGLYILFELGSERYAVDARRVVEVLPLVELKAVPGCSRGVAGLARWRGRAVPVVDLSEMALGVASRRLMTTRILAIALDDGESAGGNGGAGEAVLGLMVEKATSTLRRREEEFVDGGLAPANARYMGPVTPAPDGRGLIQLIDPRLVLSVEARAEVFGRTETEGAALEESAPVGELGGRTTT